MSAVHVDEGDTTTLPPPDAEEKTNPPKRQPPYAVVILNDDDHTVEYVITLLQKVFGYKLEKCVEYTRRIHEEGRAIVWTGWREVAELKRDQIKSGGTDFSGKKPVKYPLGCFVEPMP